MWFGVDVLDGEPWRIALREIQVNSNLSQTTVGDRNAKRRRRDTPATILSDANRSRSTHLHQVPPA